MALRKYTGLSPGHEVWFDPKTVLSMTRFGKANPPYTSVSCVENNMRVGYNVREAPEDVIASGPE